MEKNYEINLTEQELQIVFNALIDKPFKEVAMLVQKLQNIYRENNESKT